jgi:Uncharacterized protein conserved in bacteria (DUF2330)
MRRRSWMFLPVLLGALTAFVLRPTAADSACCYFAAKDMDVQQPSQKVFITWDPDAKAETFTVQPKFEGNAKDFGMVIPTPAKPKLDEMPRDFFKELAVYTVLKQRQQPQSHLLPPFGGFGGIGGLAGIGGLGGIAGGVGGMAPVPRKPEVKVVETGVVGSLDYKIIEAGRADDLFEWLKDHKYHYSGDEATLDFYVKKKWLFTVMKIDTMQMKKNKDGTFAGEVTPTRFRFASEKIVYPLKITQLSVKDKTEALFYVQAPFKTDLPGELTYQYQWLPMLQNAQGWFAKGTFGSKELPGNGDAWLKATKDLRPALLKQGEELGFNFVSGQRPEANKKGHKATTLEWAKKLTASDVRVLKGEAPYSEKVPDPDEGFTAADVGDAKKGPATQKTIQKRLDTYLKERPGGYLVREAPADELKGLKLLAGHLKEGQFLTKFRKTFAKDEMNDDLLIVSAKVGKAEDRSEYEEILPSSPP